MGVTCSGKNFVLSEKKSEHFEKQHRLKFQAFLLTWVRSCKDLHICKTGSE